MKQFTMPIIFWLMTIEDKKIREAAIRNCKNYPFLHTKEYFEVGSLFDAMSSGFSWHSSTEGYKYWYNTTFAQSRINP